MGKIKYSPLSHFLTDSSQLTTTLLDSDAFGPVKNSETTKYRTTSFVRANSTGALKVFSINAGHIALLPNNGTDKINLVIKNSGTYDPFKIKYFIYRGITKSDFIDSNGNMVKYTNTDQPKILQTLWKNFNDLNGDIDFPASLLGYDITAANDNKPLEQVFLRQLDFQCSQGDFIGSFKEKLGLDIVLDEGEYVFEKQQQPLFNLDVKYARNGEFVFDTTSVGSDVIKLKRYKEHIHQFIDAAAFWGSHIKDGKIFINATTSYNSVSQINTNFLNKYVTKNRIYIYIKDHNNRSFNYYKPKKVLDFESLVSGRNYSTHGWPILFNINAMENDTVLNASAPDYTNFPLAGKQIQLQCDVDTNNQGKDSATGYFKNKIDPRDQYLAIHNWRDIGNISSYSLENGFDGPSGPEGLGPAGEVILTYDLDIEYYKLGNAVSSTFIMLSTNLEQTFPMSFYCNKLWTPNINTPFSTRYTNFKAYKATVDKKLNVNLKDILKTGAIVKQDVIFDTGKNSTGGVKKRRLYITSIKRNFNEKYNIYNDLNIDSQEEMGLENINNLQNYINFLYGNQDFNIYRGSFNDGNENLYSLSLVNNKSHFLKNSYFHLGITDDDYKKIFSTANESTFNVSDNFFFSLKEVSSFTSELARKFELGVNYENNLGNLVTFYPSTPVYVYTLDGLFFFSKDYSDHQEFYSELSSNAVANFRPMPNYDGEFGFDWVRMGDSGTQGDSDGSGGKPNRKYKAIFGNYYKHTATNERTAFKAGPGPTPLSPPVSVTIFKNEKSEYQYFMNYNYFLYPGNVNTYYSSSWLNLYPEKDEYGIATNYPKKKNNFESCLTQASINLKLNIKNNVKRLRIQYEKEFIQITPVNSSDIIKTYNEDKYTYIDLKNITIISEKTVPIVIKSIKECNTETKIRVYSSDNNIADEKLAGELVMYPNHKRLRKKIKIALINCKSNLNGTVKDYNFIDRSNSNFTRHLYKLDRFLNHSLIEIVHSDGGSPEPQIKNYDLRSTAGSNYPTFNSECMIEIVDHANVTSKAVNLDFKKTFPGDADPSLLMEYLRKKISTDLSIPMADYLIVTAINEVMFSDEVGSTIPGIGQGKSIMMGEQSFYETDITKPSFVFGHEAHHTLGLGHTFSYSRDALNYFIPMYSFTDNLMDYPHHNANPISSTSIWWYQRYFARKNINQLLTTI